MGRRRNKEETIQRLITAVGTILSKSGYQGIGVNRIAFQSGVSKPMIYEYFGGMNNLLKAYIKKKDYWLPYFEQPGLPEDPSSAELYQFYAQILQDLFHYFLKEKEMQKLILWQISEYDPLMRSISEKREREGSQLLALSSGHFKDSNVSLKSVVALLVGGIYFIVLQHQAGNGPVAGVNLDDERDVKALLQTIGDILQWAWKTAEDKG